MWDPRHLTTLKVSMACYWDSFPLRALLRHSGTKPHVEGTIDIFFCLLNRPRILTYLLYFEKMKVELWKHLAVCLHMNPLYQLYNAWKNLRETSYVHRWLCTETSLRVCMWVSPFILSRQWLGNVNTEPLPCNENMQQYKHCWRRPGPPGWGSLQELGQ
jgi:hypothetical protein